MKVRIRSKSITKAGVFLFKQGFDNDASFVEIISEVQGKSYNELLELILLYPVMIDRIIFDFDSIETRHHFIEDCSLTENFSFYFNSVDESGNEILSYGWNGTPIEDVIYVDKLKVSVKVVQDVIFCKNSFLHLLVPPQSEITLEFIPKPKPEYKFSLHGVNYKPTQKRNNE